MHAAKMGPSHWGGILAHFFLVAKLGGTNPLLKCTRMYFTKLYSTWPPPPPPPKIPHCLNKSVFFSWKILEVPCWHKTTYSYLSGKPTMHFPLLLMFRPWISGYTPLAWVSWHQVVKIRSSMFGWNLCSLWCENIQVVMLDVCYFQGGVMFFPWNFGPKKHIRQDALQWWHRFWSSRFPSKPGKTTTTLVLNRKMSTPKKLA